MENLKKYKTVIIGLTLLFIGFIIYNNFIKKDDTAGVEDIVVAEQDQGITETLNTLQKINDINLNPDFFNEVSDGRGYILNFSDLVLFKIPENKKPGGKSNIFLFGNSVQYNNINEQADDSSQEDENNKIQVEEKILDNLEN